MSERRTYWMMLGLSTLPYAIFFGAPVIFLLATMMADAAQVPLVFGVPTVALTVWLVAVVVRAGLQGAFEGGER